MKALTTAGLTKLIQLIKSSFISVDDTVTTTTVTLADVATSGSYNDLTDKPTIPTESTVSGWGFTKNTGTVTSVNNVQPVNGNVTLANVATSGSYNDLTNKPTIPTALTDLTDTNISSPTNGQSLIYNSTTNKWVNGTQESSGVTFRDWRTQCTVTLNVTNSNDYEIKSIVIAGVDYLAEAIKNGLDPTGSSTGIAISVPQQTEATTYKVIYNTSSQATGSIDISGSTATISVTLT